MPREQRWDRRDLRRRVRLALDMAERSVSAATRQESHAETPISGRGGESIRSGIRPLSLVKVVAEKETQSYLAAQGLEPAASTPDELGRIIRSEIPKFAGIVKAAGIKPE